MQIRSLFVAAIACSLGNAAPAFAGLVSLNDPTFGPNSITLDTTTGLQWLDLTKTTNISYNQMVNRMKTSIDPFSQWKYASYSQVGKLWVDAGIPNIGSQFTSANYVPVQNLLNLIGITNGGYESRAETSTLYNNSVFTNFQPKLTLGGVPDTTPGHGGVTAGPAGTARADLNWIESGNLAASYLGQWLVRPTPLSPTTPPPPPIPTPSPSSLLLPVSSSSPVYLTTSAGGLSESCANIDRSAPGHCVDYANPTLSKIEIGYVESIKFTVDYYKQKLAETHGYYDPFHDKAHYALDFAPVGGTANVIAAAYGHVVAVIGTGKCASATATSPCIVIDNGLTPDGSKHFFTEYREFTSIGNNSTTGQPFKVNDEIQSGQLLGVVSPRSGSHLHFQVMTGTVGNYSSVAGDPFLSAVTLGMRPIDNFSLGGSKTAPQSSQIYGESNPLLPTTTDPKSDAARFNIVVGNLGAGNTKSAPIFIDPAIAVGYDYQIISGPNFSSLFLPNVGDGEYELWLWSVALTQWVFDQMISHDVEFDFAGGGVDRFRILGIDAGAGIDPNNPEAFVTGLTFAGDGPVDMYMAPIVINVPEPETIVLVPLALGLMAFSLRCGRSRRKRK
jgi:hypothetical protein